MKIAVLSDIHGNVPALEAVLADLTQWRPDQVIVNGDLVNRGPYSLKTLNMLQTEVPQCQYIIGNHEEFVLHCHANPPDVADPEYDITRFGCWTAQQLGDELEGLQGWLKHLDMDDLEGGSSLHITHGSRIGTRRGILPETDEQELRQRLGEPRALFIGSHTHRPLYKEFNGGLVVNTGSVGQPLDGDERAAYGRFTFHQGEWQAEIQRVAFDKARAVQDFYDSGFIEECGPIARLILRELQTAQVTVGSFMHQYLDAIKRSKISVHQAVEQFLD